MKRVYATDAFVRLNKKVRELGKIPFPGEVFELTDERFDFLSGNNKFNERFVKLVTVQETVNYETTECKEDDEPSVYVIEPGKQPVLVQLKETEPEAETVVANEEQPVTTTVKKSRTRKKQVSTEESDT